MSEATTIASAVPPSSSLGWPWRCGRALRPVRIQSSFPGARYDTMRAYKYIVNMLVVLIIGVGE